MKYIEINNTVRSAQTQSTKTFLILCASSKVLLSLCTSQSYYICLLHDFGMLDLVSSIGPCTLEILITERTLADDYGLCSPIQSYGSYISFKYISFIIIHQIILNLLLIGLYSLLGLAICFRLLYDSTYVGLHMLYYLFSGNTKAG